MGSIYKGSTKVNKLYVGSKAVQKVYKGSTLIWSVDSGVNSAGTATITYSNATGNVAAVDIVNGQVVYGLVSSFSNWTETKFATWSQNTGNELQLVAVLSSGTITYKIDTTTLSTITKLTITGQYNGGILYIVLSCNMPNLTSIALNNGWSGHVQYIHTVSATSTTSTIMKLLPNSTKDSQYITLKS